MMRYCRIDQAMMRCLPVDIPPGVPSLANEVDELGARFHMSTTQEGRQAETSLSRCCLAERVDVLAVVRGTVDCELLEVDL